MELHAVGMSSSPRRPIAGSPPRSCLVSSAADVLSYVPHALGFLPDESLVVITLANRRLGATLRVDLPGKNPDPLAFAQGILSLLEGDVEADGTLLIVYTKESWQRLTVPPRNTLVLTAQAVLAAAGLPARGGWLVSSDAWRDYFCIDEGCCAWPGQPLETVSYSPLSAELVYGGSAFAASATAAVQRDAPAIGWRDGPEEADLRSVEDAQADYAARCASRWTSPGQVRTAAAVWDAVLLRPDLLDASLEPQLIGFLLASIESRTVRDFLLVSACLGSDTALRGAAACGLLDPPPPIGGVTSAAPADGQGAHAGTAIPDSTPDPVLPVVRTPGVLQDLAEVVEVPTLLRDLESLSASASVRTSLDDAALVYADLLAGRFVGTITWARVDAMGRALACLIAVSDGEARAAALTMSGWFEYARGRGSRAAVYLDAAEQVVPGYRLARLLQELLRRGGLPSWARNRSTAWTSHP